MPKARADVECLHVRETSELHHIFLFSRIIFLITFAPLPSSSVLAPLLSPVTLDPRSFRASRKLFLAVDLRASRSTRTRAPSSSLCRSRQLVSSCDQWRSSLLSPYSRQSVTEYHRFKVTDIANGRTQDEEASTCADRVLATTSASRSST